MLAAITGQLVALEPKSGLAYLGLGNEGMGLTLEVMVPPSTLGQLNALVGQERERVTLFTHLELLAQGSVGSLKPRLFGFAHQLDKQFFLKLITVKGVGAAIALEMMAVPTARIAAAIEGKDEVFLRTLPRIGASKAKLLIAELSEKVKPFRPEGPAVDGEPSEIPADAIGRLVQAILVRQLDLDEREASGLIRKARELHPEVAVMEDLLQAVFEVRGA